MGSGDRSADFSLRKLQTETTTLCRHVKRAARTSTPTVFNDRRCRVSRYCYCYYWNSDSDSDSESERTAGGNGRNRG